MLDHGFWIMDVIQHPASIIQHISLSLVYSYFFPFFDSVNTAATTIINSPAIIIRGTTESLANRPDSGNPVVFIVSPAVATSGMTTAATSKSTKSRTRAKIHFSIILVSTIITQPRRCCCF